jgi:hypothetical protein
LDALTADLSKKQLLCNSFSTDDTLYSVLTELNQWNLPDKAKMLIDFFASDAIFRKGIVDAPNLTQSWRYVGYMIPSVRTDIPSLIKAKRYVDNGIILKPSGTGVNVYTAANILIGKLDNRDPYYPNELKAIGEFSKRYFDPDDSGGIITKKNWKTTTFTVADIDKIQLHLTRFKEPVEMVKNNNFMINILRRIQKGEIPATDIDKRFYTHELEESQRYKYKNIPDLANNELFYLNAHTASLEVYGVNEVTEKLYRPEVPYPNYVGY